MKSLSWSEYYLFNHNKQEYYDRYILGIKQPPNKKMELGSLIHQAIEDPKFPWLETMKQLKYKRKQQFNVRKILDKMNKYLPYGNEHYNSEVGMMADLDDIKLFGIFDALHTKDHILYEFKTTDQEDRWTQWKVNTSPQLQFYSLIYSLTYHRFFRQIRLFSINTAKATVSLIETQMGYYDIEHIKAKINATVGQLKALGWWYKRVSSRPKETNNLTLNL